MKFKHIFPLFIAAAAAMTQSCSDELSPIGGSIASGEVSVQVDSAVYNIAARTQLNTNYDSRSLTRLLGRITIPEYGHLECSFVSQFMPAAKLTLPDSITENHIDSLLMIAHVPRRPGYVTGDSLAPQKLTLYELTRQLPKDIDNSFDPTGYYDPSKPLGSRPYVLTALAESDTAYTNNVYIKIPVRMPGDAAKRLYNAYKTDPEIFQWPDKLAEHFPGIYVEQTYGSGCLANVYNVQGYLYYHYNTLQNQTVDSVSTQVSVLVRDSLPILSTAPEVLSSNNIKYEISQTLKDKVAQGKTIITTPGGYYAEFNFPTRDILNKFKENPSRLSVVSSLSFEIPASPIENEYGISCPQYLLMVKKSKLQEFFENNSIPDNVNSFTAQYSSTNKSYSFNSMRDYILQYTSADAELKDEDMEFVLVPVLIDSEEVTTNSWTGETTTYVLRCLPYIASPSMGELFLDRSNIVFTFTQQTID